MLSNGFCAPRLMLSTIVMCHNVSQLAKRAFVPERTMKAVLHPSPFTATAPLSKPRHVAVRSIIQLGNRALAIRGLVALSDSVILLLAFIFYSKRFGTTTLYSHPLCLLEAHTVSHMPSTIISTIIIMWSI